LLFWDRLAREGALDRDPPELGLVTLGLADRDLFAEDRFDRLLLGLALGLTLGLDLFALGFDCLRLDLADWLPERRRSLPAASFSPEFSMAPMLGLVRLDADEAFVTGAAAKNSSATAPIAATERPWANRLEWILWCVRDVVFLIVIIRPR
jgi:hypothetical protein